MKKYSKNLFVWLFLASALYIPTTAKSQNGSLDLSFGNAGKVITDFGGSENCASIAVQNNGKIVAAGTSYNGNDYDLALARYNTDGSLDTTFGNGGLVIIDVDSSEFLRSVAIQPDGKIVAAGYIINQDFIVVRLNADGTPDNSFGTGGVVITDIAGTHGHATSVVIQSDNKILIVGEIYNGIKINIALIRYNTDGTLDNSFANAGIQITSIGSGNDGATSVALQTDGKVVISGSTFNGVAFDIFVGRYTSAGMPDNTFGNAGIQIVSASPYGNFANAVAMQTDGKIVVGGWIMAGPLGIQRDIVVMRLNTNGVLDNSFGNAGIRIAATDSADFGQSMVILSDGKIVVGGRRKTAQGFDFALNCYNPDGSLDTNFGNGGFVETDIAGMNEWGMACAVQNDGKILLGGMTGGNASDFALVRYHYGNEDSTENPQGLIQITEKMQVLKNYPNPFSVQTTFQLNEDMYNANLYVYNITGQMVKQIQHLHGNTINFYRYQLPAGFYTVKLVREQRTIGRGSFVIED